MCTTSTTMTMKLRKVASKLLTEKAKHVDRWSRDHTTCVRESKATMTHKYISMQVMFTREVRKHSKAGWHVSTRARKTRWHVSTYHARHINTWAQEHPRHVGTGVHKHTNHFGTWHVSTYDTLVCEHVRMQGMLTRKDVSTKSTLAREHVLARRTSNLTESNTNYTFGKSYLSL